MRRDETKLSWLG